MTNLLERIKNTVMADINHLLDKKEDKNPLALLNQYVRECEKETDKVKKLLERQYKLKEEFSKELHQAEEMAEKRKRQAEVASKAGEEELSAYAQQEQAHFEERVVRLAESLKNTEQQLREIETKYMDMKHKLKDMKIRQMELMAKENITKAHHTMNKVLEEKQVNPTNQARFNEMEQYIDKLEEKINTEYFKQTMDEKLAALEKNQLKKEDDSISL
ncbi:PspA/IM30 family protein [Cytobacillus oceanisediminis]|uniref:PspA/IM30 family protein n=1 Tax=Niallia alba TaxID=2729105 RepID=A0A7Y0K5J5_9BACI|nr:MULTISPECIES: PspA/IM30 family protein [Bacillaceae]EOR24393.1 phage shock protein PspA [Niallia nealsonii AAU1]MBQ6447640.1 PspA/IM30 family protein [Bacillus sp. (in: firmicutes)]MBZ9535050.1 PspA/IM30 family protein [Cytobacillus oceanisediminis]NMO76184.1 PspA/IM30 family protein [Niallia alba]UTI43981.1 PspA/IM30 family protein [Niallia sp. RD1]